MPMQKVEVWSGFAYGWAPGPEGQKALVIIDPRSKDELHLPFSKGDRMKMIAMALEMEPDELAERLDKPVIHRATSIPAVPR